MANPSIKKGYFPIATELAKQLAKHNIPGEEMRIIWVVWLKTWGWAKGNRRKDDDWISYGQMAEITGLKRSNAAAAVRRLLSKRILLKTDNRLSFNQDYESWVLCKRMTVLSKSITGVMQKDDKTVMQKHTHKRKKETNTKENSETKSRKGKFQLTYPKEQYQLITAAYKEIKGVAPQGDEWLPILREIKLNFKAGRTVEEVINTMRVCEANYPDWSMGTVRLKIADVVSGKLISKATADNKGIVVKGIKNI